MEEKGDIRHSSDTRRRYETERVMFASKDWVEAGYQAIGEREKSRAPAKHGQRIQAPKARRWQEWVAILAALVWSAAVVGAVEWWMAM
ncbi:hypothetical protein [Pseudorhodobacter aquimaris]|uniref:hypothetical protein n=1 Tax=Pseudorhodobacter aquimaris TaxID=687412 RepID=UPI00067DDA92|nr:hypothetical protein [Pseudorhodobacter aquimaris]